MIRGEKPKENRGMERKCQEWGIGGSEKPGEMMKGIEVNSGQKEKRKRGGVIGMRKQEKRTKSKLKKINTEELKKWR